MMTTWKAAAFWVPGAASRNMAAGRRLPAVPESKARMLTGSSATDGTILGQARSLNEGRWCINLSEASNQRSSWFTVLGWCEGGVLVWAEERLGLKKKKKGK